LGLALVILSCKKDNYDAPATTFNGRLVYNGEAINVENGQLFLELWQPGFGRNGAISVAVAQDGSFSSLLFDGNYKLTISNGQGPFMWKTRTDGKPDSIALPLAGNQTLDLEVTPYYLVRNAQFTHAGGKISSTFKVDKIIANANAKNIERVTLYVNRTQFVSGGNDNNILQSNLAITPTTDWANVSITTGSIPVISPTQNYVFARVGVKIDGVEDMIFSPVTKVQTQ
jgi:hypothetical protein